MKYLLAIIVLSFFAVLTPESTASALTVSPAKVEITGDPGTTIFGDIELYNEQSESKIFFSSFENFEPAGDSGAPRFIGANGGLATWLSITDQVALERAQRVKIPFSITIPAGTEPGGYFAAIFWSNSPPGTGASGEVSIGGKIGILVLLRVSGEVEESGGILNFGANNKKFFSSVPIAFSYRVNNTGGDRIVPLGDIAIKNTFRFTSISLPANPNEGSVLPSSARKFEVVWDEKIETKNTVAEKEKRTSFFASVGKQWREFHFGWYTANLDLVWGTTNQTANASYHFFIFPWQLLIIITLFVGVVFFVLRFGLKKYNRFIIAQAQALNKKNE
jgi:hypothetical protein